MGPLVRAEPVPSHGLHPHEVGPAGCPHRGGKEGDYWASRMRAVQRGLATYFVQLNQPSIPLTGFHTDGVYNLKIFCAV